MAKDGANTAITRPSDLKGGAAVATAGPRATTPGTPRQVPPPMSIAFHGGEPVKLLEDQLYADKVLVRRGEKGTVLYPSSQAAAWVVRFPRMGAKLRVVPERLLESL